MRCLLLLISAFAASAQIRVGIIGTDTSHATAFTAVLNDSANPNHVPGLRVIAAFKGGSPDVEESRTRVDRFADELRTKYNVEIVADIPALLSKVDAVLLESVDGRSHLAQAKLVIAAKKPFFIDKPLASTLEDAREISRLANQGGVKWWSSSALRFVDWLVALKAKPNDGAATWGPGPTEAHHALELSWYGIHAVEMLYTLMGTGCTEVSWAFSEQSDVVVGRWRDGRLGTVRTARPHGDYGAMVFQGGHEQRSPERAPVSYVPLVRAIAGFFQTGTVPVGNEETLEMFAFMDAAQQSKAKGGAPVRLR